MDPKQEFMYIWTWLRNGYIGVRDCPYGICCPWVRGGWDSDALGKTSVVVVTVARYFLDNFWETNHHTSHLS